ncbi:hypothetical protein niasHT_009262 [Heterodera trifolii]|uniref:Repressor of RNA polymerase III transcription MAF1 n=1 Tax=Heterodera trifolii TaxID=157864 RepID=A0ABD2LYQ3_9BILA
MKLLDNEKLDGIAMAISRNAQDLMLDVRLESYSCKMVTNDKKEWKKSIKCPVEGRELQPLSPPEDICFSISPHSRLRHLSEMSNSGCSDNDAEDGGGQQVILVGAVSRRTLFNILALLNQCYPDYDFSQTKSAAFTTVTYQECTACVDGKLVATVHNYSRFRDHLWQTVEEAIKVSECSIYSYIPRYSGDPFTEDGCIWQFNFLFFNKSLKRFLFFACRALRNELKGSELGTDFEETFSDALEDQLWNGEEKQF